ncbi:MAG: CgeB family protein [Thermodesulforhabdaceae bacterium]|jgi:spore maturation protein CgeB
MKIVGVKPIYGGSLTVMEYALNALSQLGHEVIPLDFSRFLPLFRHIKHTGDGQAARALKEQITREIIEKLHDYTPDVLFGIAQAPIFPQVLHFCKKHRIYTVYWFVEDFLRFGYWKRIAGLYDLFLIIQKSPLVELIKKLGGRPLYLPLAADPSVHRPISLSEEEKTEYGSLVSFVGAGYPNRIALFEKLELENFKIWGSDWVLPPESNLWKALQRNGKRIAVSEYVKIFNASLVNLNLHSSINPNEMGTGDFVNPRTFEIASCRAFQIVDHRTLLGELFKEQEEIIVCRTIDQIKQAIRQALHEPEWTRELAEKAYRRTLKEHTYLHRMIELVRILEEKA